MNKHTLKIPNNLEVGEFDERGQCWPIISGDGYLFADFYDDTCDGEFKPYAIELCRRYNNHAKLVEALQEVTATLAWVAHGECRAVHNRKIMNSTQAQDMALKLLNEIYGEME